MRGAGHRVVIIAGLQRVAASLGGTASTAASGALIGASVLVAVGATTLVADPSAEAVRLRVTPSEAALSLANMAPGDAVERSVTVSNAGTLPLRYAMTVIVADRETLGASMQLVVTTTGDPDDGCGVGGDVIYSGPLASAAIGNPRLGPDFRDRVLDVGDSEALCLRATFLPPQGDNRQAIAESVSFRFSAEGPAEP